MIYRFFCYLFLYLAFHHSTLFSENCKKNKQCSFTYDLDCGRFGDQLVNYIKTLWLAKHFDGDLIYRPFSQSNFLALSKFHKRHYSADIEDKFDKVHRLDRNSSNILKKIQSLINSNNSEFSHLFYVSFYTPEIETWESDKFRTLLHQLISPITPVNVQDLPNDKLSVAIHVRKGGGYDRQRAIDWMITKFPSDQYYIDALKELAKIVYPESLYVYIFTDDPNPKLIETKFAKNFIKSNKKQNITFNSRERGNAHDKNVLTDFFSMTNFDFIIRPDSSYSRAAAAVSGPKIEIFPTGWNQYKKDLYGNPILSKEGEYIIEHQIVIRDPKYKNRKYKELQI